MMTVVVVFNGNFSTRLVRCTYARNYSFFLLLRSSNGTGTDVL